MQEETKIQNQIPKPIIAEQVISKLLNKPVLIQVSQFSDKKKPENLNNKTLT